MKIETPNKTIDVFPIRRVRITAYRTEPIDDFHRVCVSDVSVNHDGILGMNQHQTTIVLDQMRYANTDLIGNGKDFFMVRGNNLIPISHSSFKEL